MEDERKFKKYQKEYRRKYRNKRRKYAKKYYQEHKLGHRKYYQKYYRKYKKKIKHQHSIWRKENLKKIKIYHKKNKKYIAKLNKIRYEKDKKRILKQKRGYYRKNRTKILKKLKLFPPYLNRKVYTKKGDNLLKKYYGIIYVKQIIERFKTFKNRSEKSILARARVLGLHSKLFLYRKQTRKDREKIRRKAIERFKNPKERKKTSLIQRRLWKNEEYAKKQWGSIKRKPTLPEKKVRQICKLNNFPLNYTGNGKIWIKGFNPDFLSKNPKHIVEVNGEYWHQNKNKERRKKYAYSSLGYKLLVIWSKKLKDPQKVTEKIVDFLIN